MCVCACVLCIATGASHPMTTYSICSATVGASHPMQANRIEVPCRPFLLPCPAQGGHGGPATKKSTGLSSSRRPFCRMLPACFPRFSVIASWPVRCKCRISVSK